MALKEHQSRRTSKEFINYNAYQDRPFGLKWGTAFAMDELVAAIQEEREAAEYQVEMPRAMSDQELNEALKEGYLTHSSLRVYRNVRDSWGRYEKPLEGYFYGESTLEVFWLSEQMVVFEEVRAIEVLEEEKWSSI